MNMDGILAGRLIRANYSPHRNGETGTLFITVVKDRGSYFKNGERQEIPADFLSFQYFVREDNQSLMNQKAFLETLAEDNSFIEVMYQLKTYRKPNQEGQNETIQYLKLVDFAPLESKREREDRQNRKEETLSTDPDPTKSSDEDIDVKKPTETPDTDEQPVTTVTPDIQDTSGFDFDPDEAMSFVEEQAKDHIRPDEPQTTEEGLYGNPFK